MIHINVSASWSIVNPLSGLVRERIYSTARKIQEMIASPLGQLLIGFGIGLILHKVYGPLVTRFI